MRYQHKILRPSNEDNVIEKFMDIERLIHSVKTAIACMIGFLIAKLIGVSGGLWVVVTIIVVMCAQIYVGSVLIKSYMRFLGTLIGCLFAAFTLIIVGPTNLGILVTICLSSLIFSYIATLKESLIYAGTLGAATTAIILLSPDPTVSIAAQRFFEISTGILIATVTSQFILPIHARTHLKRNQANTLTQLRDYYKNHVMTPVAKEEEPEFEEEDEDIVKSLAKQRQLAKDASREPFGAEFNPQLFLQSLQCEKEILRAIIFMPIALSKIENADVLFFESPIFKSFNDSILQIFNRLIETIKSDEILTQEMQRPPLDSLKADIEKKRSTQEKESTIYIDGLLFFAEILTNSLLRLANLYHINLR